MKTKITILINLFCIFSLFSQVKESEVISRDKKVEPKIIKFKKLLL